MLLQAIHITLIFLRFSHHKHPFHVSIHRVHVQVPFTLRQDVSPTFSLARQAEITIRVNRLRCSSRNRYAIARSHRLVGWSKHRVLAIVLRGISIQYPIESIDLRNAHSIIRVRIHTRNGVAPCFHGNGHRLQRKKKLIQWRSLNHLVKLLNAVTIVTTLIVQVLLANLIWTFLSRRLRRLHRYGSARLHELNLAFLAPVLSIESPIVPMKVQSENI